MKKYVLTWQEIYHRLVAVSGGFRSDKKIYGVPTGGSVIAGLTSQAVDDINECDIIMNDVYNTGKTARNYKAVYPDKTYLTLFDRSETKFKGYNWIEFPWEAGSPLHGESRIDQVVREFSSNREEALKKFEEALQKLK